MGSAVVLAAVVVLPLVACDLPAALPGGSGAEEATVVSVERPEGWESIEDEASTMRLYYQFVDAKGQVRFVERLDDVPEAWRANVGFVKMAAPPPLTPADALAVRRQQASRTGRVALASASPRAPGLILYSAEWCGACRKAKRYLTRQGIDFELRDVDDPAISRELVRKTGSRSIPVLDAGGRILTGYSPDAIDDLVAGRA
jgi:glutaredoxin